MTPRNPLLAVALSLVVTTACGSPPAENESPPSGGEPTSADPGSLEGKIESAISAAPRAIAADATIMDWPAEEGGEPSELRAGSNGWVCFPDMPATEPSDPMCFDRVWQSWMTAWMTRTEPEVDQLGVAYMLQGDGGASNIDPFATGPTPDNQWVVSGPHLMLLTPDPADLEGMSTDPGAEPFVMWRDTPYAHVMVPMGPR